MKKEILILGAGILLVASSAMAFGGQGQGRGQGNGGGCHGDTTCMQERQEQNQNANNGEVKTQGQGMGQGRGQGREQGRGQGHSGMSDKEHAEKEKKCMQEIEDIKNGEKYDISENEKEYISHMREEEKIARDVYLTLYKKWNLQTFNNIATNSEQKHMDMVKILIDKYGLEDSMTDNTVGVFKTKEFQDLYNDLVAKGSKSLVDAIKVGLTVEDLDIYDLDRYLVGTENPDIKNIFEKLNKGSFNHAQAFKRQLDRNDGTYEPQFVSKARWEEVLNAPHMRDMVNNNQQQVNNQNNQRANGVNRGFGRVNQVQTQQIQEQEAGFFGKVWNFLFGWM